MKQLIRLCRDYGIRLDIDLDGRAKTLVYPMDREERNEIEANIEWFSRLGPAERLRTIEQHMAAAARLRGAAIDGR